MEHRDFHLNTSRDSSHDGLCSDGDFDDEDAEGDDDDDDHDVVAKTPDLTDFSQTLGGILGDQDHSRLDVEGMAGVESVEETTALLLVREEASRYSHWRSVGVYLVVKETEVFGQPLEVGVVK